MAASVPARHPARLDALTGLRFWFAFLVVVHHSLQHWFGPHAYVLGDFGYIGVDFFFVLSGFVLTWSHRDGVSRGRFWWNRVSRIWPLHLTTLLLALVVLRRGIAVPGIGGSVANLFLLQAWFPSPSTYFGFNAVSWSLSCEVFFYACFPLLVPRLARLSGRGRVAVVAAVTAALLVYPGAFSLTVAPPSPGGWEWSTYVLPLWRLGEFVVGIVTALALRDGWVPPLRGRSAVGLAVAAAAGLVGWGYARGSLPDRPFVEIAGMLVVAFVVAAVAADECAGRRGVLAAPMMVRLGAASYALYLCHALLFGWLTAHWTWVGGGGWRAVGWGSYVLLAVGVAFALHHLVEVPCERWLRRRAWRLSAARATVRRRLLESV